MEAALGLLLFRVFRKNQTNLMNPIIEGNQSATRLLILAHGAGAGMRHEFMQMLAQNLAAKDLCVLRFNFSYMQAIEQTGKRRPPEPVSQLIMQYAAVLDKFSNDYSQIFLAGKSMGGRVATLLAQQALPGKVKGILVYGFPFHPPKKQQPFKGAHLSIVKLPHLILQGERDPMGNRESLKAVSLDDKVQLSWLPDGDHSFVPRKRSGVSFAQNMSTTTQASMDFIHQIS